MAIDLILHLGAHKTGTSLVQKFAWENRALLAARGIATMKRNQWGRLIKWGKKADVDAGGDELRGLIEAAASEGARHFLISHENALGRPFQTGAERIYPKARYRGGNLVRALAGCDCRVVYYIRSQASFFESYYIQTVTERKTHSFDEWRARTRGTDLSWRPVYEDLCAFFGETRVLLRSFEDEIAQGQARFLERFFNSFTRADRADFAGFEYHGVANPSVGDKGLALKRAMNSWLDTKGEHATVRAFLQAHFSNRDYPRPELLSAAQKARARKRYEAGNAALVARSAAAATAFTAEARAGDSLLTVPGRTEVSNRKGDSQ